MALQFGAGKWSESAAMAAIAFHCLLPFVAYESLRNTPDTWL
jgi:hypothetical protein